MADYRDTLYEKYFQNQAGRRMDNNIRDNLKNHWQQLEKEILPLMPASAAGSNLKVLDLGCGYGELLMLLESKGIRNTVGIDISVEQIQKARELGLTNVVVMDAFEFLKTNPKEFDVILGIDIIEHFSPNELVKLLGYLKYALKPGGTAIFRTPNMDAPFASTYAFGDFTHQSFLNYSSAGQLFASVGFKKVEVLPSYIHVNGAKEIFRKLVWSVVSLRCKLTLFASGKSTRGVYLTPNLVIKVGV